MTTADAGTSGAQVEEKLLESGFDQKVVANKVTEPKEEKGDEEKDVGQCQCRQVVTGAAQFLFLVIAHHKQVDISAIAHHAHNYYRTQIIQIQEI